MAMKYINIFQSKALKNYPNWDFWFESKPSGNPGCELSEKGKDFTSLKRVLFYSSLSRSKEYFPFNTYICFVLPYFNTELCAYPTALY
jgi:hypothetical protein